MVFRPLHIALTAAMLAAGGVAIPSAAVAQEQTQPPPPVTPMPAPRPRHCDHEPPVTS
jgi:hypothetical protein